jgi:adenylosuccinate synthase
MANVVVLGTQWGDEGKGKVVDLITPSFDVVARYQGGHNAGHTVYVDGRKIVLHLIPSGVLHEGKLCVIGNGLVISPRAFLAEAESLRALGVSVGSNVALSRNAHLIMPYHSLLERISEERLGARRIGTTCLGIGPAYEDKAGRRGIRAGDLLEPAVLGELVRDNLAAKNPILERAGLPALDPDEIVKEYSGYAPLLEPHLADVSDLLNGLLRQGKSLLCEGAQGALLDIDHGTYPFVTSSNPCAGGACLGLGIGPTRIQAVLGILKAYTTRVGSGPFPTELRDDRGELMRRKGDEFGATTGRPRRCGWFDAVAAAYSCRLNGAELFAMTKPDVLDGLDEVLICTGYTYKGSPLKSFPVESWVLARVEPRYKKVRGWGAPLAGARDFDDLPQAFRDYLRTIEDLVEARAAIVSTGVERRETIFLAERLKGLLDLDRIRADLSQ